GTLSFCQIRIAEQQFQPQWISQDKIGQIAHLQFYEQSVQAALQGSQDPGVRGPEGNLLYLLIKGYGWGTLKAVVPVDKVAQAAEDASFPFVLSTPLGSGGPDPTGQPAKGQGLYIDGARTAKGRKK